MPSNRAALVASSLSLPQDAAYHRTEIWLDHDEALCYFIDKASYLGTIPNSNLKESWDHLTAEQERLLNRVGYPKYEHRLREFVQASDQGSHILRHQIKSLLLAWADKTITDRHAEELSGEETDPTIITQQLFEQFDEAWEHFLALREEGFTEEEFQKRMKNYEDIADDLIHRLGYPEYLRQYDERLLAKQEARKELYD